MSLTVTIWSAVFSFVFVYVLLADDHVNYQSPQYLGCNTVFDMRLRVTFLRRKTVSLQSNIGHREQVLKWRQ
jgi:hypothetical protein